MGGLTRREMLKRSAVAGGVVWASPLLSTGKAWGQSGGCCACSQGELIYAKFAPGNAQTCQNQCLQPGEVNRFELDCLFEAGLLYNCDDVDSSDSDASLTFGPGVTPIKFAIKATNSCYIARCQEGFGRIYKWSTSFNAENYTNTLCSSDDIDGCVFDDPGSGASQAMFQAFTNGTGATAQSRCTGNQDGSGAPNGTLCGSSIGSGGTETPCGCTVPITGMYFSTTALGDTLNFIEMILCVTNISLIPCVPIDC